MKSLNDSLKEYKKHMELGIIPKAYRGILDFMRVLRNHLKEKYPDYLFSGNIFEGRMDYTYFHFTSPLLKQHQLKIVILFVHETMSFEVLLSGTNRKVQAKYWRLLKDNNFTKYQFATDPNKEDYIINHSMSDDPNFSDLDLLIQQLLDDVDVFVNDVKKIF